MAERAGSKELARKRSRSGLLLISNRTFWFLANYFERTLAFETGN
jgi:hypothetical protein